ncbi:MAG: hypothetical protein R2801_08410 [Chitinophagales bacterium]
MIFITTSRKNEVINQAEKVNLISYNQYHKINKVLESPTSDQQIAVVFAEGTILDGEQETR